MGLGHKWPEPPLRSPRDRRGRFVNYAGTVTATPRDWRSPATEDDLADFVVSAANSGRRVKVVGAGHSWSAIAAPEDVGVILDGLSGIVARGTGWVRVRAGTRLRELSVALAAEGQTLPIVASISQQSVAGALATGTHGSSLEHGNLSTLILGARLVAGDGSLVELSENDQRLPGLRVHLGALGIVTELTLRTVPSFHLAESVEEIPVRQIGPRVEELGRSAEFVKVWWMPHTPNALAFRHHRTEEPVTRLPSPETQRMIENWLPRAVLPPLFAWQERRPGGVPRFNRIAARWLVKPRRVGPNTVMLSTPEPVRHHETEAALSLEHGGEAFDAVVDLIGRLDTRVNFILELRYCHGDETWLSPAYGTDVVHLGACTAMTARRRDYFDAFWEQMRRLGGRPHWAKEMDHKAPELRDLYPMADRFLALRDQLDPLRVFSNPFLDRVLGD